ncbi:hypothetical protein JKP88DRAFT_279182 [Tribonema minus]|uniref:Uncharacterized protein n=1 Tax=Tribonema minus TaxID=303371 RepID=A0A835YVU7_9STRA|nr:hypothetical protein JKP88DRAFT_279182 [Tribonema minus]
MPRRWSSPVANFIRLHGPRGGGAGLEAELPPEPRPEAAAPPPDDDAAAAARNVDRRLRDAVEHATGRRPVSVLHLVDDAVDYAEAEAYLEEETHGWGNRRRPRHARLADSLDRSFVGALRDGGATAANASDVLEAVEEFLRRSGERSPRPVAISLARALVASALYSWCRPPAADDLVRAALRGLDLVSMAVEGGERRRRTGGTSAGSAASGPPALRPRPTRPSSAAP